MLISYFIYGCGEDAEAYDVLLMIGDEERWLLWLILEEIVSFDAIVVATYAFYHMDKKVFGGMRVIRDVVVFFFAEGAIVADEGVAALIDVDMAWNNERNIMICYEIVVVL